MPQTSTAIPSAGQVSTPIQTSTPSGSVLPMSTFPHISVIHSFSTVITDQSFGIGRQSNQQQSTAGSSIFGERSSFLEFYKSPGFQTLGFQSPQFQTPVFHNQGQTDQTPLMTPETTQQRFMALEHHVAIQVAQFEQALQMIKQRVNSGSASASESTMVGNNTPTRTTQGGVSPVNMVNNPSYNAIFQPFVADTLVQHASSGPSNNGSQIAARMSGHRLQSWYYPVIPSQPAFILPQGNFMFDGRQLPPLSAPYNGQAMVLGTPFGHIPHQNYQNTVIQHQPLPVQNQQGPTMVPVQVIGQETVPRITVGQQKILGSSRQGPAGAGINQGPTIETPERTGQNVQGSNDRRFIMYQNRAVPPALGNNSATANLADPHVPQGSSVVVANPQIVPTHPTVEENREE
ncbi:OLC1v1004998C1 [Oldenlandia corymbosa var. corymbosa]|uniref:OLC1v1004998C1 n=1 Tax=Oldenlandia corymbosa var. corymbosa TaxID=529605 RepID=A0AAV1DEX0_OLDCO|nr:OLC1v1004998C1 [Oldenlandia corymbosa var. corymbosa]